MKYVCTACLKVLNEYRKVKYSIAESR